jgi:hypothetical protein
MLARDSGNDAAVLRRKVDTVHAGMPPTVGEKSVLSQRVRARPVAT